MSLQKRIKTLEARATGRPELGNIVQLPGETYAELQARAEAWRAESPRTRYSSLRIVEVAS